jgi:hypothetical protein
VSDDQTNFTNRPNFFSKTYFIMFHPSKTYFVHVSYFHSSFFLARIFSAFYALTRDFLKVGTKLKKSEINGFKTFMYLLLFKITSLRTASLVQMLPSFIFLKCRIYLNFERDIKNNIYLGALFKKNCKFKLI